MTLHEAQAQYALGLITAFQYSQLLNDAIKTSTDQEELLEIFWMIIDWEDSLKANECNIATATAIGCHFNACNAFRTNEYAPAYLRNIIQPLAKYRPLPEHLARRYPRPKR